MKKMFVILVLIFATINTLGKAQEASSEIVIADEAIDTVTIAILAKDKAHTLPLYLSCIENQTWPKAKTNLYIRTNNNNDSSAAVLKEWADKVRADYKEIYFDESDVEEKVEQFGQHEWNKLRFKVLGAIRQQSVEWAKAHQSHYFVADCDNFIHSNVIETLVKTGLPVVAPLLHTTATRYSNFHSSIDDWGYFINDKKYDPIFYREIKGLIEMPVVHCTYLVRYEILDAVSYDDESERHEYVIFSNTLRDAGIPQYLDNREVYGRLTFATNEESFLAEPWRDEFEAQEDQLQQEL